MPCFRLGVSSSIEGAKGGSVVREEGLEGHELFSYRDLSMGIELGDGCVAFADPLEHEELYFHMDWIRAAPYREASARQLAARKLESNVAKRESSQEADPPLTDWVGVR